jgi:hypothetical protein
MAEERIDGRDGKDCHLVIYEAFVEGKLEAPKHLARTVHELYFLCGVEIYVALASGCV